MGKKKMGIRRAKEREKHRDRGGGEEGEIHWRQRSIDGAITGDTGIETGKRRQSEKWR